MLYIQVAQLSLTNPSDALHHSKRQNCKLDHNHAPFGVICYRVARIDINYLCTKFDDFRFSSSTDIIEACKIFKGSVVVQYYTGV